MTPSLFVATPCYRGDPALAIAWARDLGAALGLDDRSKANVLPGMPTLPLVRALLTHAYRQSECDFLLFRDDDVDVEPAVIARMMDLGAPMVVAPYAVRNEEAERFDATFDGLQCTHAGLGCALLSREVLETLWTAHASDLSFVHQGTHLVSLFDNLRVLRAATVATGPGQHQMFWEDRAFCYRVRQAGFSITALEDVRVVHAGRASHFRPTARAAPALDLLPPHPEAGIRP